MMKAKAPIRREQCRRHRNRRIVNEFSRRKLVVCWVDPIGHEKFSRELNIKCFPSTDFLSSYPLLSLSRHFINKYHFCLAPFDRDVFSLIKFTYLPSNIKSDVRCGVLEHTFWALIVCNYDIHCCSSICYPAAAARNIESAVHFADSDAAELGSLLDRGRYCKTTIFIDAHFHDAAFMTEFLIVQCTPCTPPLNFEDIKTGWIGEIAPQRHVERLFLLEFWGFYPPRISLVSMQQDDPCSNLSVALLVPVAFRCHRAAERRRRKRIRHTLSQAGRNQPRQCLDGLTQHYRFPRDFSRLPMKRVPQKQMNTCSFLCGPQYSSTHQPISGPNRQYETSHQQTLLHPAGCDNLRLRFLHVCIFLLFLPQEPPENVSYMRTSTHLQFESNTATCTCCGNPTLPGRLSPFSGLDAICAASVIAASRTGALNTVSSFFINSGGRGAEQLRIKRSGGGASGSSAALSAKITVSSSRNSTYLNSWHCSEPCKFSLPEPGGRKSAAFKNLDETAFKGCKSRNEAVNMKERHGDYCRICRRKLVGLDDITHGHNEVVLCRHRFRCTSASRSEELQACVFRTPDSRKQPLLHWQRRLLFCLGAESRPFICNLQQQHATMFLQSNFLDQPPISWPDHHHGPRRWDEILVLFCVEITKWSDCSVRAGKAEDKFDGVGNRDDNCGAFSHSSGRKSRLITKIKQQVRLFLLTAVISICFCNSL
eukprot:284817440_6